MTVLYVSALFLSYKLLKFGILFYTTVFLCVVYCIYFLKSWTRHWEYENGNKAELFGQFGVQLCSICNFEHRMSRLILTYDL